jgi:arylsulfatase
VFTYYPEMIRLPEGSAPITRNRPFSLKAEVNILKDGDSGVLATIGGRFGGWALLVMDGKPRFDYAFSNQAKHRWQVAAPDKLSVGKHLIELDFKYDGCGVGKGATGVLIVDGKKVAEGRIERTTPTRFSLDECFDVGEDTGTPVAEDYAERMPFRFAGELRRLTVYLK